MANFTSKAIKATFFELLEEKPLNDITVKDIVETCGINRNSFYYHFQDIPTLLDEMIKEEAEAIIEKHPNINSVVECYDAVVEFISQRKKAIRHIYYSVNREMFENHLITLSEHIVRRYVTSVITDTSISDEHKEIMIGYYKCVCLGLALDWLNSGMSDEYAVKVRAVIVARNELVQEFAEKLLK